MYFICFIPARHHQHPPLDTTTTTITTTKMASFIDEWNSVSAVSFPETKKASELTEGKAYAINSMRFVYTKFGDALVATLQDEDDGSEFQIFLPKRLSRVMHGRDLEIFKTDIHTLTFTDINEQTPTVVLDRKK